MKKNVLRCPLSRAQVVAAGKFHDRLPHWCRSEVAVAKLANAFRGFKAEDCLLKVAVVNAIYGTNVLALGRMADHVTDLMGKVDSGEIAAEPPLVDQIAALPANGEEDVIYRTSFASKFCHFFIDAEKFPIYDGAAGEAIELHIGIARPPEKAVRYCAFCKRFDLLRSEAKLSCTTRELDRYLWLTGMYMRWRTEREKPRPKLNVELLRFFSDDEMTADLSAFLPAVLIP